MLNVCQVCLKHILTNFRNALDKYAIMKSIIFDNSGMLQLVSEIIGILDLELILEYSIIYNLGVDWMGAR